MATKLSQGNDLYIPFRDGKSISNSQNVPRIYQSISAFERHFPGHHLGTEDIVLQKYVPERHGRWIEHVHVDEFGDCIYIDRECSKCDVTERFEDDDVRAFCPNCGAKMDGGATK